MPSIPRRTVLPPPYADPLALARPLMPPHIASDLVTETDRAVEDMVSNTLKAQYPSYSYALPPSLLDLSVQLGPSN